MGYYDQQMRIIEGLRRDNVNLRRNVQAMIGQARRRGVAAGIIYTSFILVTAWLVWRLA